MAVRPSRDRKPRPPLDREALEQAALFYAGRYATTRARLGQYLRRKLKERGWAESGEPPVQSIIERMTELGYVDDRAFASAKAASLGRRGYGERRVRQALRASGIEEEDSAKACEEAGSGAWNSALRFAERRRIGPFASAPADRPARQKALAAMLRAGHAMDLARRLVWSNPGEIPEPDRD